MDKRRLQTPPPVSARAVLQAIQQVRRQGAQRNLEALEVQEPDLAEYLMEEVTNIHRRILDLGGPAKPSRLVLHQVEVMALVLVRAVQNTLPALARHQPKRKEKRRHVPHRQHQDADS